MGLLSNKAIRSLKPGQKRYDGSVPGLYIRRQGRRKVFAQRYRLGGRDCTLTLGDWADPKEHQDDLVAGTLPDNLLTLPMARRLGEKVRAYAESGRDPRELAGQPRNRDVRTLAQDYIDRYAKPRKRTWKEDERRIHKYLLPRWGQRAVARLTVRDVEDLHHELRDKPYEANRVLALTRAMFNQAVRWGWRKDNPASGVRPYQEESRETYLTVEQLRALAETLQDYAQTNPASAYAIGLLVFTGARVGEVLKARWRDFDLETGVWTKPASGTKSKRKHIVPLPRAAVALLRTWAETCADGEWVFPSPRKDGPMTTIKKAWARVSELAGLDGVRLHDLRHTYASLLINQGADLALVSRLLGHSQIEVTKRYAHLTDDTLRAATEQASQTFLPN